MHKVTHTHSKACDVCIRVQQFFVYEMLKSNRRRNGWMKDTTVPRMLCSIVLKFFFLSSSCCCCRCDGGDGCCRIIRVYYIHFKTILMRSTVHAAFKECRLCAQKAKNHVLFTSIYCSAHSNGNAWLLSIYTYTYRYVAIRRWCWWWWWWWRWLIWADCAHANTKYYCGLSIITIMTL